MTGLQLLALAQQPIAIFALCQQLHLVVASRHGELFDCVADLGQRLLGAHVAVERGLIVRLQARHYLFQLAHLPFL